MRNLPLHTTAAMLRSAQGTTVGEIALALISAGLALFFQAWPVQCMELTVEHFMPETSIQQREFFLPWAKRIEAASKGQIHIRVAPNMALGGKPFELLDKVTSGDVDIVWNALPATRRAASRSSACSNCPGSSLRDRL